MGCKFGALVLLAIITVSNMSLRWCARACEATKTIKISAAYVIILFIHGISKY